MTNPMIRIHNTETDEIIDRPMTDAELDEAEKSYALTEAHFQALKDKEIAKAALLEKLGLTEDEARLLVQ